MTAVPRGTAVTVLKKRPPQIAFAHFVWHFIVGKLWDSITIIAKKTLFGVHAQVSYGFDGFSDFCGYIIGLNWLIKTLELLLILFSVN